MKRNLTIMAGFLLLFGISAWGQPPSGPVEKRMERLETVKVWKLLETLDLSQEEADRFLPVYRDLQDKKQEMFIRRQELLRALNDAVSNTGNDADIKRVLEEMRVLALDAEQAREDFFSRAGQMLTVRQLGQLVLFEERFERQMRQMMQELKQDGEADLPRRRR